MDIVANDQHEVPSTRQITHNTEHSKVGVIWISLAAFAAILLLLAIFILQNSNTVQISYFGFHGSLPFGVAMLLAVVAGVTLTLLIGSVRILQLKSRRRDLEARSSQE